MKKLFLIKRLLQVFVAVSLNYAFVFAQDFPLTASSFVGDATGIDEVRGARVQSDGTMVIAGITTSSPAGAKPILLNGATDNASSPVMPTSSPRDPYSQLEAESLDSQQGLTVNSSFFGYFDNGDWAKYENVDFGNGAQSVAIRIAVANSFAGKTIEFRTGSPSGTLIGTHTVQGTGGWNSYQTQTATVDVSGIQDLYLVGKSGTNGIGNLDWLIFTPSASAVCGSGSGGPTDNPIELAYPGEYGWTSNINWECVYNVDDYPGNATQKFNAAQTDAYNDGGGIVYFPAGSYTFADDLLVKSGVVIRGATPANNNAMSGTFDPPTNFEFPAYNFTESGSGTDNSTAFKFIRLEAPDAASNVGMINVDINRAGIEFVANDKANATGENMVFYGVRTNNVAKPTPNVPNFNRGQNAYQRHSYRFAYNILAYNKKNILIANTRHNDNITDNYAYNSYVVSNSGNAVNLTGGKYVFRYSDHYVIEAGQGASCSAGTPSSCPQNFREGIMIRDNWMFHTMRTAILARGQGLKILNNVVRDQENKQHWVHPDGTRLVGNSNTLENRAIDWAGWNVVVDGNDFMVRRHNLKGGPYYSVDGEGILIQECCGGTTVNGVQITNNTGDGGYIGLYKTRDIQDMLIQGNTLRKAPAMSADIYVWADINNGPYTIENADAIGNNIEGEISYRGSGGTGSNNDVRNNTNPNGNGKIKHSCLANVSFSGNSGFTIESCTGGSNASTLKAEKPKSFEHLQDVSAVAYPNPTSGNVVFNFGEKTNGKLFLLNSEGMPVYEQSISGDMSVDIDLSGFAPGVYFGKMVQDSKIDVIKIIVE